MNDYIVERTLKEANHILETKDTVRATAKAFLISKSTVHKDMCERLEKINLNLYKSVQKIIQQNKNERHIRGGIATRDKYIEKKMACNTKECIAMDK